MQLENLDIGGFLRDYWQKQPLLIRNPWRKWSNPLTPEELAGLACEQEVEARLVMQTQAIAHAWRLEHGPFADDRFLNLGGEPWTLLVQAVDHHVPEVAALIDAFRFIPDWRIDDVMVSYASDGGGVGPHFDQYDVFLVQGLGQRRWRLGKPCDANSALLPHGELRLLADFEATEEWVLGPGDILYLPPGVAHDGVAMGDDCMTYSVGFRAPSLGELLGGFTEEVIAGLDDGLRYSDPGLSEQDNPGEISEQALNRLQAMVTESLSDRTAFARWFGAYSTAPKYPEVDWRPEEPVGKGELRAQLEQAGALIRNPASRFSFIRREGGVLLFVDGDCLECEGELAVLAERLCAGLRLAPDPAWANSDAAIELLKRLIDQGSLAFEPED